MDHPVVNKIVLSDEDFRKVAKKAGVRQELLPENLGELLSGNQSEVLAETQGELMSGNQGNLREDALVPALIYDQAELSTDNLEIKFGGAIKPNYTRYHLHHFG